VYRYYSVETFVSTVYLSMSLPSTNNTTQTEASTRAEHFGEHNYNVEHAIIVQKRLHDICHAVGVSPEGFASAWSKVEGHYTEAYRAYHGLTHIQALLELSHAYGARLTDPAAVDLAIIFHDIIYDPRSKTNEEDSAALFTNLFTGLIEPAMVEKVTRYIMETKQHAVLDSPDEDLKLFIDLDMSILGAPRDEYFVYAQQVRKEYEFVPEADYCTGREAVLQSFLAGGDIYATVEGKRRWEAQARENIAWECGVLSSGRLV
jgi:predicted metal-dependent HD superfamily phosphohydrolase